MIRHFAFALLFSTFVLSACNNSSEKNTENTDNKENKTAVQNERNDVFDAYEDLKDALVESDADAAKKAAAEMKTELDNFKADKLSPEQVESWNNEAKKLRENLDKIQAAKDIEEIRTYFSLLSEDMYANIQKYGLSDETIYYQHCPMAFEDKGANWLSEDEEINNPYFGDAMLRCGETKDTLENK